MLPLPEDFNKFVERSRSHDDQDYEGVPPAEEYDLARRPSRRGIRPCLLQFLKDSTEDDFLPLPSHLPPFPLTTKTTLSEALPHAQSSPEQSKSHGVLTLAALASSTSFSADLDGGRSLKKKEEGY